MEKFGSGIRDNHPGFATPTVGVIVLKDKILKLRFVSIFV
jgi:hypothetical protein